MTITISRIFIATMLATGALALHVSAQNATADIAGVYNGSYDGPDGTTIFTLALTEQEERRGSLKGVFTSHLSDADAAVATNELAGFYSARGHRFQLRSQVDRTDRAAVRSILVINGLFNSGGGQGGEQLSGTLLLPGNRPIKFEAKRSGAEPANAATETSKATSSTPQLASPAQGVATAIEGVYNGTYTAITGPRTLKLAMRTFDHDTLSGIFTFYDPPLSHDHAYSYSLTGTFSPTTGKFSLEPAKWLTPAPGYYMLGIAGTFDPNTGKVSGHLTSGMRHGPFEVTRDATESANIARIISSPAGPPAADTDMAGKAPEYNGPRPSYVNGVYTGFCGCATGGKMNAKLSLKATDVGLVAGMLTVDLPSDAGSAATYKLTGTWRMGVVHVDAIPWGAPAPFTYAIQWLTIRNTAGMGTIATHLLGDVGSHAGCNIDVVRDEAESAKLDDVMATQTERATNEVTLAKAAQHAKELQDAAAAALKQEEAMMKTAPPAQLASKYLVRKSRKYWDAFHGDLIREIFDGGFGDGIGNDTQFELLFTHYVEAFSTHCRDALPAKHEAISMSQFKVYRDQLGNVVRSQTLQSWTVECDSRLAPFYREYNQELQKRAGAIAAAAATGQANLSDLMDPIEDIDRFFATQKCGSAAMRQFGENLLRAAEDKLSLQQAGEKIAGAEAETDSNLPPGRYARFVDGCNGFYRDPANARYATGHSGTWCQCLAAKYQYVMTRDEEYYYANDFGPRFLNQIAQPHSTDPAWNRLHQAVEDCRQ